MLRKLPDNDPRVQPMAYVHDGVSVFEVISRKGLKVELQNIQTYVTISINTIALGRYKLAKAAPVTPPDSVDSPE